MRWLVACFALAGCGDNIPMFASGSRLEARIESGGEGSEIVSHFLDRELGTDCVFAPDRTGTWRCLPKLRAFVTGFTDAGCTQPIYRCPSCAPGDLEVTIAEVGCATATAVPHELRPTVAPTFVLSSNGICVPIVAPDDAYFAATPLDDEPYVVAELEDRDVGAGLGARTLVTADGAREMHHGYALEDRRSCTFLGGPGQPHPCVPGTPARTELGLVYFFDSGSCSNRIALTPRRDDCEATTHGVVEGVPHSLVRELTEPVFERSPLDSSCFATTQDLRFWEIGPRDDTLPTAELITIGDGAARPVYYAASGSPIEFAQRWVDVLNHTCLPTDTVLGRRCLPRSISIPAEGAWEDAQCSSELIYNPEDATHAVRFEGRVVETLHALTRYHGADLFVKIGGACTLLPDPAVLMSHVGAPIDLGELPALTFEAAPRH